MPGVDLFLELEALCEEALISRSETFDDVAEPVPELLGGDLQILKYLVGEEIVE